ncbi:Na+/H+ antiporter [Zavarzinella formosa]|uniref:Na+/H+ antiporter n=1 Tax=Zavarzinella formosa TaxID=360055 RepID=UPI0002E65C5B|nr:Na+/H+ antiporter [Zavarzinella formosa]
MHHQIEIVVGLVVAIIGIGVLARWLKIPYPILLVVGGLLLSLQDGAVNIGLNPDLVMLGFLPPLLYAAGFQTDWPAFRRSIRPILSLAVGLVLFTTVLVAWAAHDLAGLSWPAAFVLGAIVSPPDAVAAVAVTRLVRVPRIITTLLEGESLVNDASALVALRIAVAVVAGEAFRIERAALEFVTVSVGGIAIGLIGAWVIVRAHEWLRHTRLGEPKLHIALSLSTPYLLYLPAERAGVSGVLAAVSAGLYVGWFGICNVRHNWCVEAKAVWGMVEFLLTGLIFLLIGFQLPVVLDALESRHSFPALCGHAAIISGVVIGARLLWMYPRAYLPRWVDRVVLGRDVAYPPWQAVTVVGWAGMRGVVSLAAALSLPTSTSEGPFPDRDLILFLTFGVILVTLVGQGMTLPLLIRILGVSSLAEPDEETPAMPE